MAELNEEQLLLLNNMMYYSGATETTKVSEIAENMIDDARAGKASEFSGGFESNLENVEKIGNAILEDPELSNLYIRDSIDTDGVRASCFVDESGEATIAIRGTGGTYHAWTDNFQGGGYQSDTTDQIVLANFVNRQAEKFSDITITGHSKGGNLAQYATVVCGDEIDRCISFDGQGFGDEFLRKYENEIKENAGKIKSVCASGDYVNILLFSIAGETAYLETNNEGFVNNHSSYYLWESNSGQLKDGEFYKTVEQSVVSKGLDVIADNLVMLLDRGGPISEMLIINTIGATVAMLLTGDDTQKNFENVFNHLVDIVQDAMKNDNVSSVISSWIPGWNVIEDSSYLKNLISKKNTQKEKVSSGYGFHTIRIDTKAMDDMIMEIQQCIGKMEGICTRLDGVNLGEKLNLLLGYKLKTYENAVSNEAAKMRNLQTGLREICSIYINTETINLQAEA